VRSENAMYDVRRGNGPRPRCVELTDGLMEYYMPMNEHEHAMMEHGARTSAA
jgi:hypothetical protein